MYFYILANRVIEYTINSIFILAMLFLVRLMFNVQLIMIMMGAGMFKILALQLLLVLHTSSYHAEKGQLASYIYIYMNTVCTTSLQPYRTSLLILCIQLYCVVLYLLNKKIVLLHCLFYYTSLYYYICMYYQYQEQQSTACMLDL